MWSLIIRNCIKGQLSQVDIAELASSSFHKSVQSLWPLDPADSTMPAGSGRLNRQGAGKLNRRARSRVRVARFYSNGSRPRPRTYISSFALNFMGLSCNAIEKFAISTVASRGINVCVFSYHGHFNDGSCLSCDTANT